MARPPRSGRNRPFGNGGSDGESRSGAPRPRFDATSLSNAVGGTLGSLLRTALVQVGSMRDVVEREARATRSRFDGALGDRRRHDALARLGERVHARWRDGELDGLEDLPDLAACLEELDELDTAREPEPRRPGRRDGASDHRSRPASQDDGDDGTVSSARWDASRARRDRERPDGAAGDDRLRVWRPTFPETSPGTISNATPETAPGAIPGAPRAEPPRAPRRGPRPGGIAFLPDEADQPDDDAELAAYMHPDDVPAKDE